ncbi:RidA family protein [Candidatus Formimonas warabiya]|uniref:RidA family protein n=1 Tax=Formimonas warabiya TaxID=1761012 RepID=UPI001BE4A0A7|nr:RidA family protein [Candidatus Formimonas warabiya]
MENIQTALKACGASFENIVKLNIYLVQGQSALTAFQTSQQFFGTGSPPPAITVLFVSGLANPDFLLEIDAIAFIPDK